MTKLLNLARLGANVVRVQGAFSLSLNTEVQKTQS